MVFNGSNPRLLRQQVFKVTPPARRIVTLPVTAGRGPIKNRLDAASDAACGFWLFRPDRVDDPHTKAVSISATGQPPRRGRTCWPTRFPTVGGSWHRVNPRRERRCKPRRSQQRSLPWPDRAEPLLWQHSARPKDHGHRRSTGAPQKLYHAPRPAKIVTPSQCRGRAACRRTCI